MKKSILFIVWIVVATTAYAALWSRNLDLFPRLPEAFGNAVRNALPSDIAVEDLTIAYLLIASFLIVFTASVLAMLIFGWIRKVRH